MPCGCRSRRKDSAPISKRDDAKRYGAGKTGQLAHLAGAKCKSRIVRVTAGIAIGQRGNAQCRGMRGHVPAIGHHRHRSVVRAAGNLRHHHDDGQRHHPLRAAGVTVVVLPQPRLGAARCCGRL